MYPPAASCEAPSRGISARIHIGRTAYNKGDTRRTASFKMVHTSTGCPLSEEGGVTEEPRDRDGEKGLRNDELGKREGTRGTESSLPRARSKEGRERSTSRSRVSPDARSAHRVDFATTQREPLSVRLRARENTAHGQYAVGVLLAWKRREEGLLNPTSSQTCCN